MTIANIKAILPSANKPVARVYLKNDTSKIIFIGFKAGMVLEQHKAPTLSQLLVLEGKVDYIQEGNITHLSQYQNIDIQPNIMHEVHAIEDSICMLSQGF